MLWEAGGIRVPPCFIIVCQNTSISKLVYDFVSGFHRKNEDGTTTLENGRLALFRNFDKTTGDPLACPNTLLIDSEQLEAGDPLDDKFRGMAADEIARFRRERIERTGDARAGENISDQELLREVMNTVGKHGQLGGSVRCVVSVSMLTEGWDANTVLIVSTVLRVPRLLAIASCPQSPDVPSRWRSSCQTCLRPSLRSLDSDWEAEFCRVAESHPKVVAYTKNHNLGLEVPYRHSDRGTQYAAETYQAVLDEYGIVCSMSRKGDCWDNAVTESFFGTLKTELLHRRSWPTRRMAKDAVASYIEGFYNPYRLHSSLDYNSAMVFERIHDLKTSHAR